MRKILACFLVLALAVSLVPAALAASDEAIAAADALHALRLFQGKGVNPDATPIYDLDNSLTRNEAVTMLLRLMGMNGSAEVSTWETPFTDVAEWARPYVGFAYKRKLVMGTSETTFDGDSPVTAAQYLTLVLRALGYESGVDFEWSTAWELTDTLGVTHGEYRENSEFLRGDAAIVSFRALSAQQRGRGVTLAENLFRNSEYRKELYKTVSSPSWEAEKTTESFFLPEQVYGRLIAMKAEYPEGMAWSEEDVYYFHNDETYPEIKSRGCAAFAYILSDAAFGDYSYLRSKKMSFDELRVGDIVGFETHSVVVLEKHENYIVVAEGNYMRSIRWGRIIPRETAETAVLYHTRYPTD